MPLDTALKHSDKCCRSIQTSVAEHQKPNIRQQEMLQAQDDATWGAGPTSEI